MIKTTLTTSLFLYPRIIRTFITFMFFGLFFYSLGGDSVQYPLQESPFCDVWNEIKSDFILGVEQTPRPEITRNTHNLGIGFARRATPCIELMSLLSTIQADVGIDFPLVFATHTATNIANWQSTIPIENQQILEPVFQNIHANAVELKNLCINAGIGHSDLIPQDLLTEIHRLIRNIFRGYCAIFNNLAGGWVILDSQLEGDFLRGDERNAIACAIHNVQSYISTDELQDNRDAIFTNFLRSVLNLR